MSGFPRSKRRSRLIQVVSLVAVIAVVIRIFLFPKDTNAAWFDDNYGYRQKVALGNSGSADSNKKIKFDVDTAALITAGKMLSDCADTRFTDGSGKLLKYYLDAAGGACNTSSTDYYVLVPIINGSSNATYVYMYYGYASASSGTQSSQLAVSTFSPTSGPTFASEEKGVTPVLYWKFDEAAGLDAKDSSPYANDGTVNSGLSVNQDQCVSGRCIYFDGESTSVHRLYAGDRELDAGSNNFTISAWFRHPSALSGSQTIINKAHIPGRGRSPIGYRVYMTDTGAICTHLQAADDTTASLCSTTSYNDNLWHNMQFVRTGASTATLYIDGIIRQTASLTITDTLDGDPQDLVVGDSINGGEYWHGFLDEIKLYSYARSDTQVKADVSSRGTTDAAGITLGAIDQAGLSNGLVGYWRMDEASWVGDCSTASVLDSSGNDAGAKACPNGTAPSPSTGRFGKGASLDGSQYLDAGSGFGFTSSFTASSWVYLTNASGRQDDIISTMGGSGARGWSLINDFGSFSAYVSSDSTTTHYTGSRTALQNNTWYHVTMVYDAPNSKVEMYVNGERDTTPIATIPSSLYNPGNNLNIGRSPLGSNYTSGRIDDVRIYNRALSSSEARALYQYSQSPVGWWKMDEHSGATASDSSGGNNVGTLTNGPRWTTGKMGSAVLFDGTNDYITAGNDTSLQTTSALTLSAWIKIQDFTNCGCSIISKHGNSSNRQYSLKVNASGKLVLEVSGDGVDANMVQITGNTTLSTGTWYHVAGVYVPGTSIAVYVNGARDDISTTSIPSSLFNSASSVNIGAQNEGNNAFVTGAIDDARIYNYSQSPSQIVSDMNAGHPAVGSPISSAIGYWKFDEGVDNTCSGGTNDVCNSGSAGSTIDGAQSNMASPGTSTSGWTTSGKLGKALVFDGSNDSVSMGSNASLNITGNSLSLSVWVKRASASQGGVIASRGTAGSNGYSFGIGNIQGSGCTTNQIAIGKFGVSWGCINSFPADTSWHHLVIVLSGTGERAYIDGALVGSTTNTGSIVTSNTNFRIGIGTDGASLFAGSLDEMKIYNYSLLADDVKTEYNQGKAQVMGALSTESDGTTASDSLSREYCIPGDSSSTCTYPLNLWAFNEGNGTTANDTGTGAIASTLAGGVSWATGKVGKALSFDGCSGCAQDDSVSTASTTLPTIMTLEAWIYPKSTGEGGLGRILDNTSDITWFLNSSNSNRMEFTAIWSTTNGNWYATPGPTYNQWNHVVVTYDYGSTANTPTFYINGVKQTTNVGTGSPSGTHSLTAHTVYIGNNSTGARTWDGYIDEFKIFNYARAAAQAAWDYNRGAPVGWWKFDECQGTTAYDSSGSGWNGTITTGGSGTYTSAGTCGSGTSTEAWNDGASGKYNYSLAFDGSNDYVDVGDRDILNDITITAWIYWNAVTTNDGIVSKRTASEASGDWAFRMNDTADGKLEWMVWNGVDSSKNVRSRSSVSTGAWHHVAVSFSNSTNTTKLYIDGVLDTTNSTTGTYDIADTPESIFIGNDGQSNSFDGKIDGVRIFNYILSDAQIKTVLNNGAAVLFSQ